MAQAALGGIFKDRKNYDFLRREDRDYDDYIHKRWTEEAIQERIRKERNRKGKQEEEEG